VTINTAKKLLLERKSFWAGLEGQMLSDAEADLLNLPPGATGYIVKTVAKDSPGEQLGLRGATMVVNLGSGDVPLGGDIILAVDGVKSDPANLQKIRDVLTSKPTGSPYKVTVLRAGKVIELTGRTP